MPFEVMRRQQKKILAFLAILAMFLFTIDMSIMPLLNGSGPAGTNRTVVELGGKALRSSDLAQISEERRIANEFVSVATQGLGSPTVFGGYTERDLVDAYILEREADRMGLPGGAPLGEKFLREALPSSLPEALRGIYGQAFTVNQRRFEQIRAQRFRQYAGEQILASIGNQYRLLLARSMVGPPQVTPLDVFRGYRDRTDRVGADVTKVAVSDYTAKVAEPSESELKSYFEKYKDVLPDPASPTPGFKVPRKVQVAYATIDVGARERKILEELKRDGTEIRDAFAKRKPNLAKEAIERGKQEIATGPNPTILPVDLFALPLDDPQQTQPRLEDYSDELAAELARDRAREEADRQFDELDDRVISPFLKGYDAAIAKKEEEAEAKGEDGEQAPSSTPDPSSLMDYGLRDSLKELLKKLEAPAPEPIGAASALGAALKAVAAPMADKGVTLTVAGPAPRAQAADFGPINEAVSGTTYPTFEARDQVEPFIDEAFDDRNQLFSGMSLVDQAGRRFRAWKVADEAPRVPSFEEARAQVLAAWKLSQARPLAKADAEALAKAAREKEGNLNAVAGERKVEQVSPVSKLQSTPDPTNPFGPSIVRASSLNGFDHPGDAIRDALFGLKKGDVAVAANAPEDAYYVLAGTERDDATVAGLYSTLNQRESMEIQQQVLSAEAQERGDRWMAELRKEFGVPENWVPADEKKEAEGSRTRG